MIATNIPLKTRKAIFAALVAAQDAGMSPDESRQKIAEKYSIPDLSLAAIEEEGIAADDWFPDLPG